MTEEHKKRIEDLLLESDSVAQFVKDSIYEHEGRSLTLDSIFPYYVSYCKERNWIVINRAKVEREVKSLIEQIFYVTERHDIPSITGTVRGYSGLSIRMW